MKHILLPIVAVATALSAYAASDLIPGAPTDVTAGFSVQNDKGTVKLQFKAPAVSSDYDEKPLTERIAIDVVRSCWMLSEYDVEISHIDNVVPGNAYSVIDDNIPAYGYYYTYDIKASNSKGESDYYGSSTSESVYAGLRVAKPEFVKVATADKGASPLTFTVRAEALDEDGQDLGMPLTALVLSYQADDDDETSDVVDTIDNPEPGKEYEIAFEAVDGISYDFYLVAKCAFGESETVSKSIFVGEDTPGAPVDLKAVTFGDGAKITWSAPSEGRHFGWIDPAQVRYKVERVISYNNRILLAEDLDDCEYVDPCEDLSTLTSLSYSVTCYNALGDGGYASTESLTVGPSAKVPFIEHFNTSSGWSVKPDNIWTEVPEDYNWTFSNSSYASGGLAGVLADGQYEDGYAYCSGYGNPENRLVSTPVSLANASYPVLSFWYAARPDAANKLAVGFNMDGKETVADEFGIADDYVEYGNSDEIPVWVRRVVALPQTAGAIASLVFNAQCVAGANNENLCIDEILLDDYPPVATFAAHFNDGEGAVSWTAPSNSTGEPTAYEVELDGEALEETALPELPISGVDNRDYNLRVRAIYGDIPSCWSETYVFNPLTTGIADITSESMAPVVYFNLQGQKIANPDKGVYIRVSGTKTEKVIL